MSKTKDELQQENTKLQNQVKQLGEQGQKLYQELQEAKARGYDIMTERDGASKQAQDMYQILGTYCKLLDIDLIETEQGQQLDIDSLSNKIQELAQA